MQSGVIKLLLEGLPTNYPPIGQPVITGDTAIGQTLTVDVSDITDGNGLSSPSWTYQWIRQDDEAGSGAEDITSAVGSSYVLTDDDLNKYITVAVGFTDDGTHTEELTSDAVGLVYPFSILVTNSDDTPERTKTITATTSSLTASGWDAVYTSETSCDATIFAAGSSASPSVSSNVVTITVDSEDVNGKGLCIKATYSGNDYYERSETIEGIDRTPRLSRLFRWKTLCLTAILTAMTPPRVL